jgi:hypothetical protein
VGCPGRSNSARHAAKICVAVAAVHYGRGEIRANATDEITERAQRTRRRKVVAMTDQQAALCQQMRTQEVDQT